jgi:hypothetical protein
MKHGARRMKDAHDKLMVRLSKTLYIDCCWSFDEIAGLKEWLLGSRYSSNSSALLHVFPWQAVATAMINSVIPLMSC